MGSTWISFQLDQTDLIEPSVRLKYKNILTQWLPNIPVAGKNADWYVLLWLSGIKTGMVSFARKEEQNLKFKQRSTSLFYIQR